MNLRLRHCLLLFMGMPAFAQTPRTELHFTSSQQQKITVYQGTIFVNGNRAFQLPPDAINYASKRNRLIENEHSVFLFIEVKGAPKKDRLLVFSVNNSKVDSLLSAVSSDVKDLDHDTFLEFGGSEAPTPYTAADSVYYLPSKFYKISHGQITYDKDLTEKTDKKVNGAFITDPLDKNGSCCKVIARPKGH